MNFHVGQKVVCINGLFIDRRWYLCEVQPREGVIYTIRGFPSSDYNPGHSDGLIYLVEIVNRPVQWITGLHELAWAAPRFRPVVERKTDISIFTRMLTPEKESVSR